MPTFTVWTLRLLVVNVSPARNGDPAGMTIVRLPNPRKSYSNFTVQLFVNAYSKPAPTSQPPVLLPQLVRLVKVPQVSDTPVVRLVTVRLLLPTQPPPALPYNSK